MAQPHGGDVARARGEKRLSRAEFVGWVGACAATAALALEGTASAHAAATGASAEANKILRFEDIPEEALISVAQLHALIEGDLTVEDILAGKPAPEEEAAPSAGSPSASSAASSAASASVSSTSASSASASPAASSSTSASAKTSKVPVPATSLPEKGSTTKFTDFMLLDIRSHRDYSKRLIDGSRNIPAGRQLEIRIDEVPDNKPVIIIANKNTDRLAETRQTLIDAGRDPDLIRVVDGGVSAWAQAGYPTLENRFMGC